MISECIRFIRREKKKKETRREERKRERERERERETNGASDHNELEKLPNGKGSGEASPRGAVVLVKSENVSLRLNFSCKFFSASA